MKIQTSKIRRSTKGFTDVHNINEDTKKCVEESGIKNGQATLFVVGATAALTTVEYEPGLVNDLKNFFEKIIPEGEYYHHEEAWHDGNGFSHVRASLLKPSLTVPIVDGRLTLGTWQQIILVDFDNCARDREIVLQIMGE